LVHTCYIKVQPSPHLHCSALTSFSTDQYVRQSAQIHTYDAEDVSELLNSNDEKLTLDNLVEIWRQSTLEEAEEPQPEQKDRTMTVSKPTEGLGLTEAGIQVFDDTDSNEQQHP
jgi:predicted restriction endonuclease